MMKYLIFFSIHLMALHCSCSDRPNYYLDDNIYFDVQSSGDSAIQFTHDNKIYSLGREFIYAYQFFDEKGDRKKIGNEGFNLIGAMDQGDHVVEYLVMRPTRKATETMLRLLPNDNQTGVEYQLRNSAGRIFSPFESSGAVENKKNIWLHPFRNVVYLAQLNLNAYPFVSLPLYKGKRYEWSLFVGGTRYMNPAWCVWDGVTLRQHSYAVIGKIDYDSPYLGPISVWQIDAVTTGEIGVSNVTFFFEENYGFLKMAYNNINGSQIVIELVKVNTDHH